MKPYGQNVAVFFFLPEALIHHKMLKYFKNKELLVNKYDGLFRTAYISHLFFCFSIGPPPSSRDMGLPPTSGPPLPQVPGIGGPPQPGLPHGAPRGILPPPEGGPRGEFMPPRPPLRPAGPPDQRGPPPLMMQRIERPPGLGGPRFDGPRPDGPRLEGPKEGPEQGRHPPPEEKEPKEMKLHSALEKVLAFKDVRAQEVGLTPEELEQLDKPEGKDIQLMKSIPGLILLFC